MNVLRRLASFFQTRQEQQMKIENKVIVSAEGNEQPSPHQADNQQDKSKMHTLSRVTPEYISVLQPNEVFVFGSNVRGKHYGGAAAFAVKRFGAIMGQGEGLQGQSYAIPTMEGIDNMRAAVERFIAFAQEHLELTFLVTPIGCGIAGYTPEEIAPLFAEAKNLDNVHLPNSFWNSLQYIR